jgi:hypothetical protein
MILGGGVCPSFPELGGPRRHPRPGVSLGTPNEGGRIRRRKCNVIMLGSHLGPILLLTGRAVLAPRTFFSLFTAVLEGRYTRDPSTTSVGSHDECSTKVFLLVGVYSPPPQRRRGR